MARTAAAEATLTGCRGFFGILWRSLRRLGGLVAATPRAFGGLVVVVEVADVDDDDSDEEFEGDACQQHGEDKVVKAVATPANVQEQFELCDLSERENGQQGCLRLHLTVLQLTVSRQRLGCSGRVVMCQALGSSRMFLVIRTNATNT